MGLYNSVVVLEPSVEGSRVWACRAGHPILSGWQSKSLGDPHDFMTFYVDARAVGVGKGADSYGILRRPRQSRLESARAGRFADEPSLRLYHEGGRIFLTHQTELVDCDGLTCEADVYAPCDDCAPVLTLRESPAFSGDIVRKWLPWVELRLVVVEGRITQIAHDEKRSQTRDMLRADLTAQEGGNAVLPDDDRLAIRHMRLLAERAAKAVR